MMGDSRVVPVSGRLILVNGLGSIFGPLGGTVALEAWGLDGMLYAAAAAGLGLAIAAFITSHRKPALAGCRHPYRVLNAQITSGDGDSS
jgi:hypothetical protein